MIADYYNDTKNVKRFIPCFHCFDSSIQTCITLVRNKVFPYCKKFLKQSSVEYDATKKPKTTNDGHKILSLKELGCRPKVCVRQ